ncbi:MAG: hypothetical protein QM724_05120 [Flavobacteriales bacterium]
MTRRLPAAFLFAAALLTVATGCRRSTDPERLAALDRLLGEVDSLEHTLDAMDTLELVHARAIFDGQRDAIELRFKDTLSPQAAVVLGNYHRAMAQALPLALSEHRYTHNALDSTRIRLSHLRHDLLHGLLSEAEERTFLAEERTVVNDLAQRVGAVSVRLTTIENDRVLYKDQVDPLLRDTPAKP